MTDRLVIEDILGWRFSDFNFSLGLDDEQPHTYNNLPNLLSCIFDRKYTTARSERESPVSYRFHVFLQRIRLSRAFNGPSESKANLLANSPRRGRLEAMMWNKENYLPWSFTIRVVPINNFFILLYISYLSFLFFALFKYFGLSL